MAFNKCGMCTCLKLKNENWSKFVDFYLFSIWDYHIYLSGREPYVLITHHDFLAPTSEEMTITLEVLLRIRDPVHECIVPRSIEPAGI